MQKQIHQVQDGDRDAAQLRRRLTLIRAACLGLTLAIAIGLPLAWQIDRWLVDWHYRIQGDYYVLPDAEQQPGAFARPEARS